MNARRTVSLWMWGTLWLAALPALWGAAPAAINYQGKLSDAGGTPLTGAYAVDFAVYDAATGGAQLHAESHPGTSVVNGVFSASINVPASVLQGGTARYLQVTVNGTALLPRERLAASPYALAVASDSVTDAEVAAGAAIAYSKLSLAGRLVSGDISGTIDVAHGGTGAGTAAAARGNLGAAASTVMVTGGTGLTGGGDLTANRSIALNVGALGSGCGTSNDKLLWDGTQLVCGSDAGAGGTTGTANNLAGGAPGAVPYQSAAGTTAMLGAGASGQVLRSNGAAAPSWLMLGGLSLLGAVGSAEISNGSIVDADVSAAAGIASTKISGLGSLAALNNVNNGNWSGTALALTNGGTGSTTQSGARTNIGLGISASCSASGDKLLWDGTQLTCGSDAGAGGSTAVANNLSGGSAGTLPYQTAANTTAMLGAGASGQVLRSNGTAAPSWLTLGGLSLLGAVGSAEISNGSIVDADVSAAAGIASTKISGLGSLAALNNVNNGNWSGTALALTNGGTGSTNQSGARTNIGLGISASCSASGDKLLWDGTQLTCGTDAGAGGSTAVANNLSGGSAGTLPYQTAANTTAMLGAGTSGQVLRSNGAAAPSWLAATNANTANALVLRDGSGNFSAGTITASLSGNAATATSAATAASATLATTAGALSANPANCAAGQFAAGIAANGAAEGCAAPGAGAETDPEVGTISANGVPRWNGSALVTGSVFDDGTNVGIGTASPISKLHLHSTGGTGGAIIQFSNATTGVTTNDGASVGYNGINEFIVNNRESSNLLLMTNNTPRMTILSSGNIGIGTSAPTGKLDVVDAVNDGGTYLVPKGVIFAQDTSASSDDAAVFGRHSVTDFFGIGVSGEGAYTGVVGRGVSLGGGSSQRIGVHGLATGSGSNYGVYGEINGGGAGNMSYAVYGLANAGTGGTVYAGKFVGDVNVTGNFTVSGTKSFRIPHPTKPGKDLIHYNLEGPESGVYYRGSGRLVDGKATVLLPDYFEALTLREERTVQLTAKGESPFMLSAGAVASGRFQVFGSRPDGEFYWEVKAIRANTTLTTEVPSEAPSSNRPASKETFQGK